MCEIINSALSFLKLHIWFSTYSVTFISLSNKTSLKKVKHARMQVHKLYTLIQIDQNRDSNRTYSQNSYHGLTQLVNTVNFIISD